MGRTSLNVRDKFRQLGGENHEIRTKQWTLK